MQECDNNNNSNNPSCNTTWTGDTHEETDVLPDSKLGGKRNQGRPFSYRQRKVDTETNSYRWRVVNPKVILLRWKDVDQEVKRS